MSTVMSPRFGNTGGTGCIPGEDEGRTSIGVHLLRRTADSRQWLCNRMMTFESLLAKTRKL
jgi:hypothetical protein